MDKKYVSEVGFWDEQLSGKGIHSTPVLKRCTLGKMYQEFPKFIIGLLEEIEAQFKRLPNVMDVGSGPLSQLAWGHQRVLKLSCIDPLMDEYKKLLKKHKIKLPKYVVYTGKVEDIETIKVVKPNSVDLVWVHNALDHTDNPLNAFMKIKTLLVPGGYLLFQGWENEGKGNGYFGLHQHDIYWDEGLCVKTHPSEKENRFDVSGLEVVETYFQEYEKENKKWLKVIYRKAK